MTRELPSLLEDARGAVFVEKLIVYIPLMLTFFLAWELAELAAASLVVQRASAAAGRAAVVVLPDDPIYYDGEAVGSFSGRRQDDIELAAGMVLSANPKLSADFTVDVSDPPDTVGPIDVDVTAPYKCGTVSLMCGVDGVIELHAKTTHTYQGAKYVFTSPAGGGLGGSTQGLVANNDNHHAGQRSDGNYRTSQTGAGSSKDCDKCPGSSSSSSNGNNSNNSNNSGLPKFEQCNKKYSEYDLSKIAPNLPLGPDPHTGKKGNDAYGESGLSKEAFEYRCKLKLDASKNIAVLQYQCKGQPPKTVVDASTGKSDPNDWDHSEQNVLKKYEAEVKSQGFKVSDCKTLKMYTERDSCYQSGGPSCNDFLTKGGEGMTKAQGIETPPDEIKQLSKNVDYHFEYNDNYQFYDTGRCKQANIQATATPEEKKICKKLADGEDACKKVFGKNSVTGSCDSLQSKGNNQSSWDMSDEYAKYDKNSEEAKKADAQFKEDMKKWSQLSGPEKKTCPKPTPPGPPKNYKPTKDAQKPTPENIKLAEQCLETMNLKEAFSLNVPRQATEAIENAMKQCP